MALTPTDLGTASTITSGLTVVATVSASAAVGDTVLVAFALRRTDRTLTSITDSAGNTYSIDKFLAGTVCSIAIGHAVLTSALTSGVSTVTATFSGVATTSARHLALAKVTAALTKDQDAAAAHTATTAWATGSTATTTVATELLFGAATSDDTTTSTAGGSTTELHDFTANTQILTTVYRLLSGTGTYAASGTFPLSGNGAAAVVTFYEAAQNLSPTGIASTEAFGTPVVTPGAVTVTPTGIASAEALGTPVVKLSLAPTGIASAEAFGTPVLTTVAYVAPTGIASAEAFGIPIVATDDLILFPTGIPSAEAFGTPVVAPGAVTLAPTGIASSEAFGTPTLKLYLVPTGIASAEAFGTPTVATVAYVLPTGIASAEAFGTPLVVALSVHLLGEVEMGAQVGLEGTLSVVPGPTPPPTAGTVSFDVSAGSADGGTFTATLDGETATIPWNATADEFEALMVALAGVDPTEISVVGVPGSWTVTVFDTATFTINTSGLTQSDGEVPGTPDLPGSMSSSATFDARWESGQHIGGYRPTLRVGVRRGRFNHDYKPWASPDVNMVRSGADPDLPWQATWTPHEAYTEIPGVLSVEEGQSFDQEGLKSVTLQIENIAYVAEGGGHTSFHRGLMSPLRGYVADGRTALTDEHGVTVGEDAEWFDKIRENAQITVWQNYGEMPGALGAAGVKTFTGLIDDVDVTSKPDTMVVTMRCFGGVLADCRVFGWNKDSHRTGDPEGTGVADPVIFIDQDLADRTTYVGSNADASSFYNSSHEPDQVLDSDSSTAWWSESRSGSDLTEYVEIDVPQGRYSEISLSTDSPGFDIYVSVEPQALDSGSATLDGDDIDDDEWYDAGLGDVPGATHGGIPYVTFIEGAPEGRQNVSLGGVFRIGAGSRIRVSVRNLVETLDADDNEIIIASIRRLMAIKRTLLTEAVTQKWFRVADVTDVVRVVLRWAGFKEWEIEDAGVGLKKRLVVNRGMTYMDVIKLVKDGIGYDFFIKGPTASSQSIGVPVFRKSRAVTNDEPSQTVTDELLLGAITMRLSDENRAYIIRVRGRESNNGDPLGGDRTLRVMYSYRPPWSAQPGTEKWHMNGGVLRHLIHTNHQLASVDGCKVACYYIALNEALTAVLATVQIPAHPSINLDDHIELQDLATGISTRVNVRDRRLTQTVGEEAAWMMTFSGALVDTSDVQEIVALINAAETP